MDPATRFAGWLARADMDEDAVVDALYRPVRSYERRAAARWLAGDVVPGARVRRALLDHVGVSTPDQEALSRDVEGELDPFLRLPVDRLCEAVRRQQAGFLAPARVLRSGVVIDGWDETGRSALWHAVDLGDADAALMLLAFGAHPNAPTVDGSTPWAHALASGCGAVIEKLRQYARRSGSDLPTTPLLATAGARRDDPTGVAAVIAHARPSTAELEEARAVAAQRRNRRIAARLDEALAPPPPPLPADQGPTWYDPDAEPVMWVYTKAFGLGFDPRSLTAPVLFGGDYDGTGAYAAEALLQFDWLERELKRMRAEWFLPFMHKLARGEDFSMEDLKQAGNR